MELIRIKERKEMLDLCNDQGFLADSDKEMIAELNYVIDQLSLHLVSKSLMSEYKEEKPLILKNILYEFTDHKTSSINEVDFEDVVKRIIEET